ncbi:hypothetical protein EJB05_40843, partial [Eragrostis curvula]
RTCPPRTHPRIPLNFPSSSLFPSPLPRLHSSSGSLPAVNLILIAAREGFGEATPGREGALQRRRRGDYSPKQEISELSSLVRRRSRFASGRRQVASICCRATSLGVISSFALLNCTAETCVDPLESSDNLVTNQCFLDRSHDGRRKVRWQKVELCILRMRSVNSSLVHGLSFRRGVTLKDGHIHERHDEDDDALEL